MEAFQALSEVNAACFDNELDSRANQLTLLHRQLCRRGRKFRAKKEIEFNTLVSPVESVLDDTLLLWSIAVSMGRERTVNDLWTGPYKIKERLAGIGYVTEPEASGAVVQDHSNQFRRTSRDVT